MVEEARHSGTRRTGSVTASRDGIPIAYEARGTGAPALVFVHGWSCDRTYWAPQVNHFASRCRTVAIDLGGHGESGVGRQAWTMQAFGEDVVAVADALGLRAMVLVGHSMGGDVIVEAARRLSERVKGLVWVDTYFSLGRPRTKGEVEAFIAPLRAHFVEGARDLVRGMFLPGTDSELVDWIVNDMSSAPPDIALAALAKAITFEPEILVGLRQLNIPITAINGSWRSSDIASLKRYGIEVALMSGVGHFPMVEAPERFNRILGEVIERRFGISGMRQ